MSTVYYTVFLSCKFSPLTRLYTFFFITQPYFCSVLLLMGLVQESLSFPPTVYCMPDQCAASTDFGTLLQWSWQALCVSWLLQFSHLLYHYTLTQTQTHIYKRRENNKYKGNINKYTNKGEYGQKQQVSFLEHSPHLWKCCLVTGWGPSTAIQSSLQ